MHHTDHVNPYCDVMGMAHELPQTGKPPNTNLGKSTKYLIGSSQNCQDYYELGKSENLPQQRGARRHDH